MQSEGVEPPITVQIIVARRNITAAMVTTVFVLSQRNYCHMEILIIFVQVRDVLGTRLLTASVETQLSNGCNHTTGRVTV